jgi:hypothetical protein
LGWAGRSRIIARFPFRFKSEPNKRPGVGAWLRRQIFLNLPQWLQHIQQNTVLDDDNIFLAHQVGATL